MKAKKKTYPTIPVGTKVKAIRNIFFMDGDCHLKGQILTVEESTQAYFEVNHHDYEILK
jgi:hypothetical protein